jgi:uncharacterized surface protein with fasciclin (FAS1) repeats
VTVLVPVDEAFDRLPDGALDGLLNDPARLKEFVGNHVLEGIMMESHLKKISSARTISGTTVSLSLVNGTLRAGSSRFLFTNTEASNGVVHAIYPALLPQQ